MMKIPYCMVFSKTLLPSLRILIAKELVDNYGFPQLYTARILGVSQPLLNYYLKGKRKAKTIELLKSNPAVISYVKKIAKDIANNVDTSRTFCDLCTDLRAESLKILRKLNVNLDRLAFPKCIPSS
jgi:hypothetical protein